MQKTTINLARRPFRNNTLHYLVFSTCIALLLAATGYNIYDFFSAGAEIERLEQALEDRSRSYTELAGSVREMKDAIDKVDLVKLNTKSKFANGLIVSHLFSWSALFDRLEDLAPPDVKVRSIRPSISTDVIEIDIDGMARLQDALYEFEANLDGSEYFSGVYPRSESSRESRNELNFRIRMDYLPAGEDAGEEDSAIPPTPTSAMPQPGPGPEAEEGEAEPGDPAAGSDLPEEVVTQPAQAVTEEPAETAPQPPALGSAKSKAGKAGKFAGRNKSGEAAGAAADPNGATDPNGGDQ